MLKPKPVEAEEPAGAPPPEAGACGAGDPLSDAVLDPLSNTAAGADAARFSAGLVAGGAVKPVATSVPPGDSVPAERSRSREVGAASRERSWEGAPALPDRSACLDDHSGELAPPG